MKRRKNKARSTGRGADAPEPQTPRTHGDAYDDVQARDDGLAATSSSHQRSLDRRAEEPSDTPIAITPPDREP